MSVCSYRHRLQTGMKQVHPNWECLTRKHLNQLVNQRVLPSPLMLGPYSPTITDTSPLLPLLPLLLLPVRSHARNPFVAFSGPPCFCQLQQIISALNYSPKLFALKASDCCSTGRNAESWTVISGQCSGHGEHKHADFYANTDSR